MDCYSSKEQNTCRNHQDLDSTGLLYTEEVEEQAGGVKSTTIPITSSNKGTMRRYLGVRQRPSGRWPEEGAMDYDDAARLLRGTNAKTNFPYTEIHNTNNHEGNICRSHLTTKNPRFYQLLRRAILKNLAKSSSTAKEGSRTIVYDEKRRNEYDCSVEYSSVVEETVACCCSSDYDHQRLFGFNNGCKERHRMMNTTYGFSSFGSSKVYSSVIVAPSNTDVDGGKDNKSP
ncbi:hypothetical protein MKX01_014494 [Papaver californicum]|nr:hypothetical protein MKX01_014494 [Papaver californicum]